MTQRNDKQLTQDRTPDTLPLEAQHTPGPWKVVGDRDLNQLTIVQESTGGIIATIEHTTGFAKADIANARLIASAPALLEALRNSNQVLLDVHVIDSAGLPINDCACLAAKQFRANEKAIRDAEGKI